MSKRKVKAKVNGYAVVVRAVEEGSLMGWRRAHKYTSKPTEEIVTECMAEEIMNSLCEVVDFDA